jgi:PhzF family phenazine biosynthesis protein
MQRRFCQLDVFTAEPYRGNPLAVVLDAEGLTTEAMQRFAAWTNLSETTFLLPPTTPDADYRVRIFTPSAELPFAGHPTLGTCHAWLTLGGGARTPDDGRLLVQECGIGLVEVRREGARLAFSAPRLLRGGPVEEGLVQRVAGILGIARGDVVDAAWVDNGPGWVAVRLRDAAAVLAVVPGDVGELDLGVVGTYPPGSPAAIEVRAFFGVDGTTREDPVTGSLNASLAQWLVGAGVLTAPYVAHQGTMLGRAGVVRVDTDRTGGVWIGGDVVTCIEGRVHL